MQVFLARVGMRPILWGLALGWLLATTLAWIGSVVYADSQIRESVVKGAAVARQEAELATGNLNQRLIQARSIALTLSMDPSVVRLLGRFGPNVQASPLPQPERGAVWLSDPAIQPTADRLPEIVHRFGLNTLWLTNAAGDTVAEGRAPNISPFVGTNYADREYFKAAQRGQVGRQFAIGRATNVYGLYFSAPVQVDGQFVGMVGVGMSVPRLGEATEKLDALVTDDLGVIVLARDPGWLLQTMPDATVSKITPQQRDQRYKRSEFQAAAIQPVAAEGLTSLFTLSPDGRPHVIQSSATDDGALTVHVLRDMTQTFDQIQRDQLVWFALVSLLAFLTAALIASAANYIISTQKNAIVLQDLNAALAREASTDALTGCANRRHFMQKLALERERAQRYKLDFCVLTLDIDHFKRVNDTYGHAAGDQVLKHLVNTLQEHLRDVDTLGRVGGEEFSILLPQTTIQGGLILAERLRAAVADAPAWFGTTRIPITISVGGAHSTAAADHALDRLLALADEAMYSAKHSGRNRVEWSTPPNSAAIL